MSVSNTTVSCIGCSQPYDDALQQPQVLDCGHGVCQTCLPNTPVCQTCHHVVQAPIPNFELLDQMNDHSTKFTAMVVKTTKKYQDLAKSLDEEIRKVDTKLNALKDKIVAEVASEITDESKDLEPKFQELVSLGVFDDIEQAKSALSSAKPKVMPCEKFFFKTESEDSTKAPDTDSIYSCGICLDSYTAVGAHEPLVFSCGHGSCVSCVDYMQKHTMESCHLCRKPLNTTVVNKDLIGQMNLDTKALSERFRPHQKVIEFKQTYLCESKEKFNALKDNRKILSTKRSVMIIQKASEMGNFVQLAEKYANHEFQIRAKVYDHLPISIEDTEKGTQLRSELCAYVADEIRKPNSNQTHVIEAAKHLLHRAILSYAGIPENPNIPSYIPSDYDITIDKFSKEVCNIMEGHFKKDITIRASSSSMSSSTSTSSASPFQGFIDAMEEIRDSFSSWFSQTPASNQPQPQSHTTTTVSTTSLPSSAQSAPQRPSIEDHSDED